MTSIRHSLILGSLLAALAGSAFAQDPAPQAAPATPPAAGAQGHHFRGHGPMNPAERQQRFAKRMGELKTLLQITPAQENAWNAFTQAMQPTQLPPHMNGEALAKMTTPQRIDAMQALQAQRAAEMNRRGEATKTFYAALNPQQQQAFDQITARRLQGHGGRHGWRHHGERGEHGQRGEHHG